MREERASKKTVFWSEKMPKTPFFGLLVFIELWESSEIQFGRPKKIVFEIMLMMFPGDFQDISEFPIFLPANYIAYLVFIIGRLNAF